MPLVECDRQRPICSPPRQTLINRKHPFASQSSISRLTANWRRRGRSPNAGARKSLRLPLSKLRQSPPQTDESSLREAPSKCPKRIWLTRQSEAPAPKGFVNRLGSNRQRLRARMRLSTRLKLSSRKPRRTDKT